MRHADQWRDFTTKRGTSGDIVMYIIEDYEKSEEENRLLRQRAEDAEHVIIENGIPWDGIEKCGCESCKRTLAGLEKAGYRRQP